MKASYNDIAAKLYELQAWCCEHQVAIVAFVSHNSNIITMEHSSCPKAPLSAKDSETSKMISQLVVGTANAVADVAASTEGRPVRKLVFAMDR